jgi:hypothetical protein
MNKIYILAFMLLMGQSSWAQIREFQTSRLNSTAGAGVASMLSTEAGILNPAASAFFDGSSFSYQRYTTTLRHENEDRKAANDDFSNPNRSQGIFMADHDGPLKGGFAYLKQDENNFQREQIISHAAAPISKSTALGISYHYIQDTLPKEYSNRHQISHQLTMGLTHALDDKSIIGLVIVDPTRTTPDEERALAGLQYAVAQKLTLIADAGAQYTKDIKDKYLWRAALQLQIFDDFFFRVGKFYDNVRESKGTGWGVSWTGPKLGVEFAQKFSEQFGENSYVYQDETLVDTSISAIIKF